MKIIKCTVGLISTNCYFAIDEKSNKTVIVDPGGDFEVIKKIIEDKLLKIEKIILTHAHFDHFLALEEVRKYTKAPVLIHRDDAEMLIDNELNLVKRFIKQDINTSPAEELLQENDIISFGDSSFRVMHTPGHTLGSVCLISSEIIISGDTLFCGSVGRCDLPLGNANLLSSSLMKLKELTQNYRVLPGHGEETTLDFEKENNIYLK